MAYLTIFFAEKYDTPAMKILHTSDWHLGQNLYGHDRYDEHAYFLSLLAKVIKDEKPDAMIVSGDVFHQSNPSSAVQKLYTDRMAGIMMDNRDLTVVVIAGNHDSGTRLEIDRTIWGHMNLHVTGTITKSNEGTDFDRHIIKVPGKGIIIAVPHTYRQNFPASDTSLTAEQRQSAFFEELYRRAAQMNEDNLPIVAAAHLAVTGSRLTGQTEGLMAIGGEECIDKTVLGRGYDYMALGHIHCPQNICTGNGMIRYCGTPLPLHFDETYPHSVTVAEISRHGSEPDIRTIPIPSPIQLVTLPEKPKPFREALEELKSFPDDRKAYIRLNVSSDGYLEPDAGEKTSKATEGKECIYCCIKVTNVTESTIKEVPAIKIDDIKEKSELEIAKAYYGTKYAKEMDIRMETLLKEAIDEIKKEK